MEGDDDIEDPLLRASSALPQRDESGNGWSVAESEEQMEPEGQTGFGAVLSHANAC